MCDAFLREAQREPSGELGRSIVFAVNQAHATAITKILNEMRPDTAITITSRVDGASDLAKRFRDRKLIERVAVSVDMLSTGYNCRDLLNVVLMRPIFSPTEYIQIKGRGTRLFTFRIGDEEFVKRSFSLLDFCAVAEYFEEHYDYRAALRLPREESARAASAPLQTRTDANGPIDAAADVRRGGTREIPTWQGDDQIVTRELRIVGPTGEKVDVMTFRGTFQRDIRAFAAAEPDLHRAIEAEDDDAVEAILQERFFHRPEMYYAPDKLMLSYGIPATASAFVYDAIGKRSLPSREEVREDAVSSLAARFGLTFREHKLLSSTVRLITDDGMALNEFLGGHYDRLFERAQFRALGGLQAVTMLKERDALFNALAQSSLVKCSRLMLSTTNEGSR
jgi:type I restriction enzyme, R subunit